MIRRLFSSANVHLKDKIKVLNPEFTPKAHKLSSTYIRQQERLEKLSKLQEAVREEKIISETIAARQISSMKNTSINQKTGQPFYNMQVQKSSAHLYKEARLNKVPFESVVSNGSSTETLRVDSSRNGSNIWMPLIGLLILGVSVEAAVVYAKGNDYSKENTKDSSMNMISSFKSKELIAPHREIYSQNTSQLIQKAVIDYNQRILETKTNC